jgi:hypothetical protein
VSSLSTPNYGGLALQSNDGKSIYYFGGTYIPNIVDKFNIETHVTDRLPIILPSPVYFAGGLSINGTMFIFNGRERKLLEFSEELEVAKIIGDIPFQVGLSNVLSTTAISNDKDGSVWLFAGSETRASHPVIMFNVTSKDVDDQVANTTSLPTLYQVPVSISDGKHGYLTGGLGKVKESDGDYYPTNGIIRYKSYPIISY